MTTKNDTNATSIAELERQIAARREAGYRSGDQVTHALQLAIRKLEEEQRGAERTQQDAELASDPKKFWDVQEQRNR